MRKCTIVALSDSQRLCVARISAQTCRKCQATFIVQSAYSMQDFDTRKREIDGLIELSHSFEIDKFLIITKDDEEQISQSGIEIEVIPVWKWLLNHQKFEK